MTGGRIGMGDVNPYDGLEDRYFERQSTCTDEEVNRLLGDAFEMLSRVHGEIENVNTDEELADIDDKFQHIQSTVSELKGMSGGRQWDYRDIQTEQEVDKALYQMARYYGFDESALSRRFWNEYKDGRLMGSRPIQRALATFEVEMLEKNGRLPL